MWSFHIACGNRQQALEICFATEALVLAPTGSSGDGSGAEHLCWLCRRQALHRRFGTAAPCNMKAPTADTWPSVSWRRWALVCLGRPSDAMQPGRSQVQVVVASWFLHDIELNARTLAGESHASFGWPAASSAQSFESGVTAQIWLPRENGPLIIV